MHIELINPREKLSPSLGGTGYLPPAEPATVRELLDDADRSERHPDLSLGFCVWKVAAHSVGWHHGRYRATRRLRVNGKQLPCRVLGSMRHWYFVAVRSANVCQAVIGASHVK